MTKSTFGVSDTKFYHGLLYNILDGRVGKHDSLYEEMDNIQKYLESCYFLSINPLPQLRRILPQFLWRFDRCESIGRVKELVEQSDLIWRVNCWVTDWSEEEERGELEVDLVTANPVNSMRRRKIFFAGDKKASEKTTPQIEFVRACGGEPEYAEIINQ